MDVIRIENLEVYAHHGVYPQETAEGQSFYFNVWLYADTRQAGRGDELSLSTDYGEVCHFIDAFTKEHTCKLIEAAAEQLAQALLLRYPHVERLALEVRKPSAPIGLPFASVSVKIERGWHTAAIAAGSNLGDKERYLKTAAAALAAHPLIRMTAASDFLVSAPYGGVEQDDFLNGAFLVRTLLTAQELLEVLQGLEQEAKRVRDIHWGPRTLDLDLIFYDDAVIDTERLSVPHPDMQNRDFVLKPLAQLMPHYRHPLLGRTVRELLEAL